MKRDEVYVDFSVARSTLPPNFYGTHVASHGGETSRIDLDNNGIEESFSDFEEHRIAMDDAKINYIRRDMDLDNVANEDFTFNHYKNNPANIDIAKSQVAWAAESNKKILLETTFMPPWLAERSNLCSTRLQTCEPKDYRVWGSLILAYLHEVGCDKHPGTCEIEVWNEPYLHLFFLSDASCQQRIDGYIRLYTNTRAAIKARYPDMPVGGPSGYIGSECSKEFLKQFLEKVPASEVDFVTIHTYADAKLADQITESMNLIRASGHGTNVKITELGAATSGVDAGDPKMHEYVISSAFVLAASTEPTLTSITQFQWADDNKYSDGLPHYTFWPHRREMFSEALLDNAQYAGYRVSKQLGTIHPAGSTIVESNAPDGMLMLATRSSAGKFVTVVNRHRISSISLTVVLSGVDADRLVDVDSGISYPVVGQAVDLGFIPSQTVRHYELLGKYDI